MINKHFIANSLLILCCFYSNISFSLEDARHNASSSLVNHENHPVITAVVPQFFPPFYHTDQEGLPYGMAIEVLNEIDHDAGYLTKYIVKKSWGDVFKAIDSGEAQLIPNLGITEARKKNYFFTQPYAKTDIVVFTRPDNIIKKATALTNLQVGVVKKNVGKKIAKQRKLKNVHAYDSINLAFDALINKKIDAIIYPKLIANTAADRLNIKHLIYETSITLKTIHRAIAVSKKYPELFEKLNAALNNYMRTQDFKDTNYAWYGKKATFFTRTELVFLNLFVLIFTILFFNYFWRKRNFSILNNDNNKRNTVWVVTLISILITATSIVTLSTLWILYETSFNEERLRLIDMVKSRARLIEAIARYDIKDSKQHNRTVTDAHTRTLSQIINAHKNLQGFGETGEFTLARKDKNEIKFVLQQRHSHLVAPKPVNLNSKLAAPMRLALLGHSGTIIGKDYRGENVLAAYEPVSVLNLGIVAKIDLSEIREPYIRSALYILIIVILVSLLGSLLFFYIIIPIINKIKETEQRFHQLFLNNYMPILLVDANNAQIIEANKAAIKYYGYTLEELKSYKIDILAPTPTTSILPKLQQIQASKDKSLFTQQRLQNGDIRDVEILMSPVKFNNETLIYCVVLDITKKLKKEKEHHQLQKELEQAHKMEALGQLTGGIAHDFNNILGIIMGYTDLSREKLSNDVDNKIPGYLEQVSTATNRAKELISSMMLFSRSGQSDYQAINISPLVKEDLKMLRSIIPTSVEIISHIEETLPATLMEPTKLQQLLMNLCVNARDAMDNQGTLTVNLTCRKIINETCFICFEQFDGEWVDLSVTDTGSGMSDEVKQHLFEPFFTTKEKGKGTGMGMAVVHGIVQDLKGHVLIDTEVGKGTTIHILFKPVEKKDDITRITKDVSVNQEKHHERILIVDDEESLSELLGDMLEIYGYQCTCFSSSNKALAEFSQSPEKFDLIISDQTMPELTGLEMIKKMRAIRADIPVIIATGHSDNLNDSIAKENNIELLNKPLPKEILLETMNNIFKDR